MEDGIGLSYESLHNEGYKSELNRLKTDVEAVINEE